MNRRVGNHGSQETFKCMEKMMCDVFSSQLLAKKLVII